MKKNKVAEHMLLGHSCGNCAYRRSSSGNDVCGRLKYVKKAYLPKLGTCQFWLSDIDSFAAPGNILFNG